MPLGSRMMELTLAYVDPFRHSWRILSKQFTPSRLSKSKACNSWSVKALPRQDSRSPRRAAFSCKLQVYLRLTRNGLPFSILGDLPNDHNFVFSRRFALIGDLNLAEIDDINANRTVRTSG